MKVSLHLALFLLICRAAVGGPAISPSDGAAKSQLSRAIQRLNDAKAAYRKRVREGKNDPTAAREEVEKWKAALDLAVANGDVAAAAQARVRYRDATRTLQSKTSDDEDDDPDVRAAADEVARLMPHASPPPHIGPAPIPAPPKDPIIAFDDRLKMVASAVAELKKANAELDRARQSSEDQVKKSPAYAAALKRQAAARARSEQIGPQTTREERQKIASDLRAADDNLNAVVASEQRKLASVAAALARISDLQARLIKLQTIEILDTIADPNDLKRAGDWAFKGDVLRCVRADPAGRATLYFPDPLPEQYVLTLKVRRIGDSGLDIIIPLRDYHLVCEFNSTRHYPRDDIPLMAQATVPIAKGDPHTIRIETHWGTQLDVTATVDGVPTLGWELQNSLWENLRTPSDLDDHIPKAKGALAISMIGTSWEFYDVQVAGDLTGMIKQDTGRR